MPSLRSSSAIVIRSSRDRASRSTFVITSVSPGAQHLADLLKLRALGEPGADLLDEDVLLVDACREERVVLRLGVLVPGAHAPVAEPHPVPLSVANALSVSQTSGRRVWFT